MSIAFNKFVNRLAEEVEFKPLNNALLNLLIKIAESKYKNYPRLLNKMKDLWPTYSDRSRISHLLKDHHQDIFVFYLNTIFPFRKSGLTLEDPEAPTPVDFKLIYKYHYNLKEIAIIEEALKSNNIQAETAGICKRLLIFTVSSMAPLIEEIFQRPWAFQFSSIDSVDHDNGEIEVVAIISAREQ